MPQKPADEVAYRRTQVSKYYLQGWSQQAIAVELGVSQGQISQDLDHIRVEWENSTVTDFNKQKIETLKKIDNLEAEAWRWFYESAKPLRKKSTKFRAKVDSKLSAEEKKKQKPEDLEQYNYEEERLPNPQYMMIADRQVERRIKVLGLEAPLKVAQTDTEGKSVAPTMRAWVKMDFTGGRPVPAPDEDYSGQ